MYKDKNLLRHDKRYISDDFGICGAAIKPCIERKANIYKNEDVPSALSFTVTVERPMRLNCEIVYPWEKTVFSVLILRGTVLLGKIWEQTVFRFHIYAKAMSILKNAAYAYI